jgi:hypothetical protein
MSAKPGPKKSAAALQHPIRVVPLHRPEAPRIAAAATPQLTYRGGPLLTAVEVFTVFWGAEWKQSAQSAIVTNMNLFFDYILTSTLMDQLGEYSVLGKNIGHGKRTGTATLTSPAPTLPCRTARFKSYCSRKSRPRIFRRLPNSLYFFFTTRVQQLGGSASCKEFCGYHDATSGNIFYAVMPYPGCSGCTGP